MEIQDFNTNVEKDRRRYCRTEADHADYARLMKPLLEPTQLVSLREARRIDHDIRSAIYYATGQGVDAIQYLGINFDDRDDRPAVNRPTQSLGAFLFKAHGQDIARRWNRPLGLILAASTQCSPRQALVWYYMRFIQFHDEDRRRRFRPLMDCARLVNPTGSADASLRSWFVQTGG